GIAVPDIGFAALVVAAAVGLSMLGPAATPPQHGPRVLGGVALGVVAVFLALLWMFYKSDVLPTHDSTALPRFAQVMEHGQLLSDAYPRGRSGHAYPPGGPLLFRYAFGLMPPLMALWFMKMTSLAAV